MRLLLCLLCCLPIIATAEEALFDAVCLGDTAIQAALDNGADADQRDAEGQTALHRLFRCGANADDPAFHQATRILLDAGAPLDIVDQQGRTPLHAALEHVAEQTSAVNLYIDGARLLIARGADPMRADNNGVQPLHLAAAEPNAIVSQLLLDLGADPYSEDASGYDALWYALAAERNLTTFALLFQQRAAQLDDTALADIAKQTAHRGQYAKLNLILEIAPTIQLPPSAATQALAEAIWQGAVLPTLERINAAGAEAESLQQLDQRDLAWRLAALHREDELRWLIAHGWDINVLPYSGYPSLYFADDIAVTMLLAAGANPNLRGDIEGTVLTPTATAKDEYADINIHTSQGRSTALFDAGYEPKFDALGQSDLALAIGNDDLWLVRQLLTRQTLSVADYEKAVVLALRQGRLPLIQSVLRASPIELKNSPLVLTQYLLSENPDPVILETLLIAGADPNAVHSSDDPALLLAARRQLWPLVSVLLQHGADPTLANAQGCTLRCYEWSMPENLQAQLHKPEGLQWQAPTLDQHPGGFFALAMIPTLMIWIFTLAWRLVKHQSLIAPTLWLSGALISAVLTGGALFYQCDPCVLQSAFLQSVLTALVAVSGYFLCMVATHSRQ